MQTVQLTLESLARLLELRTPADQNLDDIIGRVTAPRRAAEPGAWRNSGVFLVEGTALKFTYADDEFYGEVKEGKLDFSKYSPDAIDESPSRVAMDAVLSRTGKRTSFNGWGYILANVRNASGEDWVKLADLRKKAQSVETV